MSQHLSVRELRKRYESQAIMNGVPAQKKLNPAPFKTQTVPLKIQIPIKIEPQVPQVNQPETQNRQRKETQPSVNIISQLKTKIQQRNSVEAAKQIKQVPHINRPQTQNRQRKEAQPSINIISQLKTKIQQRNSVEATKQIKQKEKVIKSKIIFSFNQESDQQKKQTVQQTLPANNNLLLPSPVVLDKENSEQQQQELSLDNIVDYADQRSQKVSRFRMRYAMSQRHPRSCQQKQTFNTLSRAFQDAQVGQFNQQQKKSSQKPDFQKSTEITKPRAAAKGFDLLIKQGNRLKRIDQILFMVFRQKQKQFVKGSRTKIIQQSLNLKETGFKSYGTNHSQKSSNSINLMPSIKDSQINKIIMQVHQRNVSKISTE